MTSHINRILWKLIYLLGNLRLAIILLLFIALMSSLGTSWFLTLLFLFGGSLMSCTLSRQIPSLKLARLWRFFKSENNTNKMGITFSIYNGSLSQFSYLLRQRQYNVIQQGSYIYAYKGLVGKIGPILVHLSIICILVGSVLGSLSGFMLQELIPKGELFHLQNIDYEFSVSGRSVQG